MNLNKDCDNYILKRISIIHLAKKKKIFAYKVDLTVILDNVAINLLGNREVVAYCALVINNCFYNQKGKLKPNKIELSYHATNNRSFKEYR